MPKMAAILMLLWGVFFSFAMTATKFLPSDIHSFMVVAVRSSVGLMCVGPFMWYRYTGPQPLLKTQFKGLHILRVLCSLVAMYLTYEAYRLLPLAVAAGLGITGPLFVTFLSNILFKEHLSWRHWMLLSVGSLGVLCVAQPFGGAVTTEAISMYGVMCSLLSNLIGSFIMMVTKNLSKTEPPSRFYFYSNIAQSIIFSSLTLGYMTDIFGYISTNWMYFLALGFFGALTNLCHLFAISLSSPSFLAPFEYLKLCFSAFMGYLVFHHIPSGLAWVGYGLIVISVYSINRLTRIKSAKTA